jgi:hypothetical protein
MGFWGTCASNGRWLEDDEAGFRAKLVLGGKVNVVLFHARRTAGKGIHGLDPHGLDWRDEPDTKVAVLSRAEGRITRRTIE